MNKQLIEYGIDDERRRIYLMEDIDNEVMERVTKAIHIMRESHGPIEIWINSPGGELEATFGVYDVIQRCDPAVAPVHTIVSGMAASAAFLLLVSGHKRFATESSWGMAHHASGGGSGSTDEVVAAAQVQREMENYMWHLLSRHTKKTALQWKNQARDKGEVWMTADTMLSGGIIDEIYQPHPDRKFRKSSTIGKPTPKKEKKNGKSRSRRTPRVREPVPGTGTPDPKKPVGVDPKVSG